MGDGKLLSNEVDEEEGSMEADTGELLRYKKDLTETGSISRTAQKGRRPYGEKLDVDSIDNHFDDIKEACSGTEEGQRLGSVGGKLELEASDEKNSRTSLQGPRKRSRKMFFRRGIAKFFRLLNSEKNIFVDCCSSELSIPVILSSNCIIYAPFSPL